jgi:hypothetical protein
VDACPYDALRCGPDFELAHESREEPDIDLLSYSAVQHDTEISYVRRERDWMSRALAAGRDLSADRQLPVLPARTGPGRGDGNSSDSGNGHAAGAHELPPGLTR